MRKLVLQAIKRTFIAGAVFTALAPLVPICAFIYFVSPKATDLDEV